jgi:hypothetical protein
VQLLQSRPLLDTTLREAELYVYTAAAMVTRLQQATPLKDAARNTSTKIAIPNAVAMVNTRLLFRKQSVGWTALQPNTCKMWHEGTSVEVATLSRAMNSQVMRAAGALSCVPPFSLLDRWLAHQLDQSRHLHSWWRCPKSGSQRRLCLRFARSQRLAVSFTSCSVA